MRRPPLYALALPALGGLAALLWWPTPPPADPPAANLATTRVPVIGHPQPTENRLGSGAEKKSNAGRKEWHKRMHRSARGVDWEAIERNNGLAQVRRRAALTRAAPAPGSGQWVERGSSNQAGRTHVTRLSSDGTSLYVGSALGGLWRGTLDGEEWEPLADDAYGGVHFVEVIPSPGAPDVLVTASDGGIVLRSTDDGATWASTEDLGSPWWVRRLVQASDGSGTLFLVTAGSEGVRLLRSEDSGASWDVIHDFAGYYGDIWTPRDGDDTFWLLDGDAVRVSHDQGDTWEDVGAIPAASGTGDLVGSEAGGPTLYAILDGGTLWRSDDAGANWNALGTVSDAWGGSLVASVIDPDLFAFGGVEVHLTRDGGGTFESPNYWWDYYTDPATLLHADIQGFEVMPDGEGGETWYVDTDGGTYRSFDGLETVENLSLYGLRISQYYDVLTSSENPDHVAMGAQDQGYQVTNGVTQDDDVFEANQVLSGDYGHLTSGDGTHAFVYSVYPGFVLIQRGEDEPELYTADFPGGEAYVPWLPPIVADPEDRTAFFFPATRIWKYDKDGANNTWIAALWSEQSFAVASDEYVSRLAFSPVDPNRAWATTSYGRVWYSDDKGVTWAMSTSMIADENWYYGQAIAPSRTDTDVVTIGGSGYGVPAVYRSTDGGRTFAPWSDGLPDTLVYTLVEAGDDSGTIFAGTQTAAYRRDPDDTEWRDITDLDAPVTIYWDAEALAHENTIRFATYGRGVWDYQIDADPGDCYGDTDADGDGAACGVDCDDTDATVFPGAPEACDGVDKDCDAATPAGGEADEDGDGSLACADCADLDPVRHPAAEELCGDGIDEDCDGEDPACAAPPGTDDDTCGCATVDPVTPVWLLGLAMLARRRR